jgi:hypothetical protein
MADDGDGQKGHYGRKGLNKLHDKVNGVDNGACLTGHQANFKDHKPKVSCNYRYQGYEHANTNGSIKRRLHSYTTRRQKKVETSAPTGKNGRYPARYCTDIAPPRKRDWHLDGPDSDIKRGSFANAPVTVKAGKNFTQDTWPYWNNAHHLIPKGTLKARILQEDVKVSNLIQQCLLEAKYNINFKINMLLLPQDREVAKILNIPRHLQLTHPDGSVKIEVANHPVYNQLALEVDDGLNDIIKSYATTCKNALKKVAGTHNKPNAKLDKTKLEDLSDVLLKMILRWKGPLSLDAKAKAKLARM